MPRTTRQAQAGSKTTRKPALKPRAKKDQVSLDEIRRIALSFPGVEEGTSSKTPVFRVRGRYLARLIPDDDALAIKTRFATRDVLTGAKPDVYYITDRLNCWPVMLIRLSKADLGEVRQLVEDAWRMTAPMKLVHQYDASSTSESSTADAQIESRNRRR
jgi:hypothetical protein